MATIDVTQENFEQIIAGHDIVIVDFSAAVPDAALPPPSLESWAPWWALHFMYYNFGRVHKTLRVTPAMEAKVADHVWSLEEIAKLAS
jgi:hypothetical protein